MRTQDDWLVWRRMGTDVISPDAWAESIVGSYLSEVGEPLCHKSELMDLPAAVLCHDRSDDPRIVYANLTAQQLWARSWEQFIGSESQSAS